ncbi:MAG: hypothetical protein DWI22_07110 [Planctomycetota bacterium]|jgi:hypothetical protein|nr:MAG: hypothetical protein DWI22_07110 [Planctomycetota bacterium]
MAFKSGFVARLSVLEAKYRDFDNLCHCWKLPHAPQGATKKASQRRLALQLKTADHSAWRFGLLHF